MSPLVLNRRARRASERERQRNASDPVRGLVPEIGTDTTSTASLGTSTARRDATRATAARTGATADHPRSLKTKRGVDTVEVSTGSQTSFMSRTRDPPPHPPSPKK